MKRNLLIVFGILFLFNNRMSSQSGFTSTGGEQTGNSGSVSFSMGQIDYFSIYDSTGFINQGLQQPYEIYDLSDVKNEVASVKAKAFPNPTQDYISLEILAENLEYFDYKFRIYDIGGNLIYQMKIMEITTKTDISNLVSGVYFLKILKKETVIKNYKIIKK